MDGVHRMGLELTALQVDQFIVYLQLLQHWSSKINLIPTTEAQSIIDRHFCDSLALWTVTAPPRVNSQINLQINPVPQTTSGELLDIGSGGGFPGIPLKVLAPSLSVTLLEPRQKRAAFLQTVIAALGCSSTTVAMKRLIDISQSNHDRYNWIVTRGIGHLDDVASQALSLLVPGGLCALYLSRSQPIQALLRGTSSEATEHLYRLPFSGEERRLILLRKKGAR